MNIIFRILLAVYAFCLTIISLIAMFMTLRPTIFKDVSDYVFNDVLVSRNASIFMFLFELIFFVLSIIFLFSGFRSNKERKVISKYSNLGEIKISLISIESISLATAKKLNSIKDIKAHVSKDQDNVIITLKIIVNPEINIPMLSEDLQTKVKKAVEESTNIKVTTIKVLVDNISTGYKSRVE